MRLMYGDKGELVLTVQKRLLELGYIVKPTGVMDNLTVRAVIRYQRASGIFVNNGQVDAETLKALKII